MSSKDLLDKSLVKDTKGRRPPQLICNFRSRTFEQWQEWSMFKKECKDLGLDVCHVLTSLTSAWRKANETIRANKIEQIVTPSQIINLQMQNTFLYQVSKPRREPQALICSKKGYTRTISSRVFDGYILYIARELNRSFSFFDFLQFKHAHFRKSVLRLKKQGKILALEPRSNPRFYILTEWKHRYPTMK